VDTVWLALEVAPVGAMPPPGDPAWVRWLSPAELAYCHGLRHAGEHLVARAIAKAVAAQAAGWTHEPPWVDLEIRRQQLCGPELVVVGELRDWCERQHLAIPGVSMSHAAGHAAAIAWTADAFPPAEAASNPADALPPAEAAAHTADAIPPAEAASNPADALPPAEAASNTTGHVELGQGRGEYAP
jgi:holo-[acyl-carrier protein] synthase